MVRATRNPADVRAEKSSSSSSSSSSKTQKSIANANTGVNQSSSSSSSGSSGYVSGGMSTSEKLASKNPAAQREGQRELSGMDQAQQSAVVSSAQTIARRSNGGRSSSTVAAEEVPTTTLQDQYTEKAVSKAKQLQQEREQRQEQAQEQYDNKTLTTQTKTQQLQTMSSSTDRQLQSTPSSTKERLDGQGEYSSYSSFVDSPYAAQTGSESMMSKAPEKKSVWGWIVAGRQEYSQFKRQALREAVLPFTTGAKDLFTEYKEETMESPLSGGTFIYRKIARSGVEKAKAEGDKFMADVEGQSLGGAAIKGATYPYRRVGTQIKDNPLETAMFVAAITPIPGDSATIGIIGKTVKSGLRVVRGTSQLGLGAQAGTEVALEASYSVAPEDQKTYIREDETFTEAMQSGYASEQEALGGNWFTRLTQEIPGVPIIAGDRKSFKEGTTEYYENKGLTGQELKSAVSATERQRAAGLYGEVGGVIGANIGSELLGQKFVSGAFKSGSTYVTTNQAVRNIFFKTGFQISKAGVAEGVATEMSKQSGRYENRNYGNIAISGAVGGVTAGVIGGAIPAAGVFSSKLSQSIRGLVYITDPYEPVGDLLAKEGVETVARIGGRTVTTPTITREEVNIGGKQPTKGKPTVSTFTLSTEEQVPGMTATEALIGIETQDGGKKPPKTKTTTSTFTEDFIGQPGLPTEPLPSDPIPTSSDPFSETPTDPIPSDPDPGIPTGTDPDPIIPIDPLPETPTEIDPLPETPTETDPFAETPTETYVDVPVFVAPTKYASGLFLPFGASSGSGKGSKKRQFGYLPSFDALAFGITAQKGTVQTSGLFSGQEIRPMIVTTKSKKTKKKDIFSQSFGGFKTNNNMNLFSGNVFGQTKKKTTKRSSKKKSKKKSSKKKNPFGSIDKFTKNLLR